MMTYFHKPLLAFLLGLFLWLGLSLKVEATVTINEVHPAPESGQEWVEIYNDSDLPTMVEGWVLYDKLNAPSHLGMLRGQLEPHQYHVIYVSNKLNNSGDGLELRGIMQETIDQMDYDHSVVGQSWSRRPNGKGEFLLSAPTLSEPNDSGQPSPTPTPTITPLPSTSPSNSPSPSPGAYSWQLRLNEINACPSNGDTEWLELFNPTNTTQTVTNWKVRDASGQSKTFSSTIASYGLGVVSWTGSLLNNSGDTLKVETPDGHIVAEVELNGCTNGSSWNFANNEWILSTTPTKGSENNIPNDDSDAPAASATPTVSSSSSVLNRSPAAANTTATVLGSNTTNTESKTHSTALASLASTSAWPHLTLPKLTAANPGPLPTPTLDISYPQPNKLVFISGILIGITTAGFSLYQLNAYFRQTNSHSVA